MNKYFKNSILKDAHDNWFIKNNNYKEGFFTKLDYERLEIGISENIVREISSKRNEPKWMLDFRLRAYNVWLKMNEPHWLNAYYKNLNYNNYSYYSVPLCDNCNSNYLINNKLGIKDNKYLTKEVKYTFDRLGIPVQEGSLGPKVAIDAIFDSVSVSTTYRQKLSKLGIVFCSFNDAIHEYPDLVKKYLGSVVSIEDNFFAALNSAVASDGTFVYVPKGVFCPMELSTYFRINSINTGQFERTILIADEDSYVSYVEGCSATSKSEYQLHAAVVEVILLKGATVKYSTIQNWFSGSKIGEGILNFVTKRALCIGNYSKMSWVQLETGSGITWKYPSVILQGDYSSGSFFSVTLTNNYQQADTGTKMIHIGKNTSSTIISKGISVGNSRNTYRGLVRISDKALNSRNFTQCDSMLIGNKCGSYTFPCIKVYNDSSNVEHEATTSKIGEEQLFYCFQRGISRDNAISIIVNGFCQDILLKFPLEFAIEAKNLLNYTLENSVG